MPHRPRCRGAIAALPLALLLAACQTASQPAPQPAATAPAPGAPVSPVTPAGFHLPEGGGCAGEVARFKAIMDNDLSTGHTTKPVYERVTAEIAQADATCRAGNGGAAIAQIRATKSRFGYP